MALRWGPRVFAPHWAATLVVILLLPTFVALGQWQLRRADYKRELMAQAAAGQRQTLTLNGANAAKLMRYQHVSLSGHYDSAHQVLLDNMPSQAGQAGYRVLTPLRLADNSLVLVDRGWVPPGRTRKELPELAVNESPGNVQGIVDELPAPGVRLGRQDVSSSSFPMVLNYPPYETLRMIYGERLLSRIVLLDLNEPNGYERHWQINAGLGPERHIAYAVQWFGFALTLLLIYVFVNLRKVEKL